MTKRRKFAHFEGLLEDKTAAGSILWRVRVKGARNKKIPVPFGPNDPVPPGERPFLEHYLAARAGKKLESKRPASDKGGRGTLDELCTKYLAFLEQHVKAGSRSRMTLSSHRTELKQACETPDLNGERMGFLHADLPMEAFVHIQDGFGTRTGAADTCMKALRAAYSWGAKRGYPKESKVFEVEKDSCCRRGRHTVERRRCGEVPDHSRSRNNGPPLVLFGARQSWPDWRHAHARQQERQGA